MATEYVTPVDDRPACVGWEEGVDAAGQPAEIVWWRPAVVPYGGRDQAEVVLDSKGEMFVFHGAQQVGVAAAVQPANPPRTCEFWPLGERLWFDGPAAACHSIRSNGWMLAQVDGVFGLAETGQPQERMAASWSLAWSCVQLGFYPPLGVGFEGTSGEFEAGVALLSDRHARRVKRAVIDELANERRALRQLADRISAHWR